MPPASDDTVHSVRVARTVEELEELYPPWRELLGRFARSDPDHYLDGPEAQARRASTACDPLREGGAR